MDHTPNKQSKTDAGDILTLEDFSDACASQRDVFDTEYEGTNMELQFSQSSFEFASNRPTPTTVNYGGRRYDQMSRVARKPVFAVSDQVCHKMVVKQLCTSGGFRFRYYISSKKQRY